jgi:inosine-uridine nucleoside N-ribohydrolase
MLHSNTPVSIPIPIILDTDIGDDIDDTWALAMLLKSPELDVRLITTATRDTTTRARIVAKMLEVAGRTDIPIGIGVPTKPVAMPQADWVAGYDLARYPGTIHTNGVGALIDTIMNSPQPITLVCIGPLPNIAAALAREPRIAERARFVGMHGSVRRGYNGTPPISAEWNVVSFPRECQQVFTAGWDMTITPVDTCGLVTLQGEKYRAVRDCPDPVVQALMENYRAWCAHGDRGDLHRERSSVLFDTVAIYLAFSEELLSLETLGIQVTDDGYTLINERARPVRCATQWKDLPAFEDFLVQRLTA